jgi:hypothetical protein
MRTALVAAALLAATPALGAQAVALSVEGLTRASDAVVHGQVRRLSTTLSPDGRRIFTLVELEVGAALRGEPARVIQLIVPGGVSGAIGQRVDGAPAFAEGEEVVVFLHRAEADSYRVTGLAQGKFSVAGPQARPDLSHLQFVARQVPAGERAVEPMPVAELERRVRSAP